MHEALSDASFSFIHSRKVQQELDEAKKKAEEEDEEEEEEEEELSLIHI